MRYNSTKNTAKFALLNGKKGKEGMKDSPEGVAKYLKQNADKL